MNTKIKLLGLALLSIFIMTVSCSKKTDDAILEELGTEFVVTVSGDNGFTSTTGYGKMDGNKFVITSDHGDMEITLNVTEYKKGDYYFDNKSNNATFTYHKDDASKIYTSTETKDNYIKITNIHTDGGKFDGKFKFMCMDKNSNIKNVSGSWVNLPKK
jgi:hypothetical protein